MKSKEKLYTFYKSIVTTNEYGDRIENLIKQPSIKIWISDRDITDFEQIDLEGLKWEYTGITKDQRIQKNDIIDNKRVVYIQKVNGTNYLYLNRVEGRDDSE